jgi:hypothetical protein
MPLLFADDQKRDSFFFKMNFYSIREGDAKKWGAIPNYKPIALAPGYYVILHLLPPYL